MKQEKLLNSAITAHMSGDLSSSELLYRKFLRSNPVNHSANNNLGLLLLALGRAEEAALIFQKLVKMFPLDKYAIINLGNSYVQQKKYRHALECYKQATEATPDLDLAWTNYANSLKDLGRYEESLVAYDKTLLINLENANAWTNRGISLFKLNRFEEALKCHEQSIAIDPTSAAALVNQGSTLLALHQHESALASVESALRLRPDLTEAWGAFADILVKLHNSLDAMQAYEKAIALNPKATDVLNNYAELLAQRKDPKAVSIYQKLHSLEPERDFLLGQLMSSQFIQCDWSSRNNEMLRLIKEGLSIGKRLFIPFSFLSMSNSPEDQLAVARIFLNGKNLTIGSPLKAVDRINRRLRIAYISGDFREHAVTYLMRGVFESHDRSRFETFAVSFNEQSESPLQSHLKTLFDHWLNIENESDVIVAERMQALGIDIAVNLTGHTLESRTGLFARRIAPVQVNYLGYPGTMGADFIDYIIADQYVIPPSEISNYAEAVVYLPNSFQANDSKRVIPKESCSRNELGIPDTSFVFCCLNNSYKITPEIFSVWMRLLKAIEGSVLWLLGENQAARDNLCKTALNQGVGSERLIFSQRLSYSEYLGSYRVADLFLDTFPFNAGTTASDALWAGLPVLTCSGRTFASRMAGSLLCAIELSELITNNLDQYEDKALELARNPKTLNALRNRLEVNRLSAPLFDTAKFTHYLESAYSQMHDQALDNSNKVGFAVA